MYYYVKHQYKDQARATWGEDVLGLLQGGSGKKQGVESGPASPNASLLFGRVVTMNSARDVIDDGVVGISGDTIIHVGTRGDKVPTELAGAPQVETSGTLYPGLIELHNHPAYNEIPLWDPPQKYTNRKQWRAASDYARKIKTPAAIPGNNTDTDYPRAIARFVECKALFGGTTTFAGLAAKDGHNYVGLVRNIEFPDRATWPVAIGHINDFESVKEAEQELGPILNDPSKRFLLHLSEGVDDDSRRVFHNLQRTDGSWLLSPILLGIHATGLAPNELSIMTASGGIVWSPLSNFFCMARPLMSAAPWKPGFQLRSAPTGLLVAARTCLAR